MYIFIHWGKMHATHILIVKVEYEIDFLFTPHLHLIIIGCIPVGHIHYIYTNGVNGVYVISHIHLIYSWSICVYMKWSYTLHIH